MFSEPRFQIKKVKQTKDFGRFVIEPLQQGYGQTLGNSLRRVLLTSLSGAAATKMKVSGAKHKFSTLQGLKEDLIELTLNVKQLKVKYEGRKPVKLKLEAAGPGSVKAGKIKVPAGVEIINPDFVLANLADKKSKLKMEITVERGSGYLPAEAQEADKLGVILLDASFTPVRRVDYRIETTRVGREADWDRLILEIFTDGTIKPLEALKEAAKILTGFFQQVVSPKKVSPKEKKAAPALTEVMKLTVEEMDLPTRIANALRKGGYGTAADLAAASDASLMKVKNLGEKSIKIVKVALAKKGVM